MNDNPYHRKSGHPIYPKYHPIQLLLASIMGDKRAKMHLSKSSEKDLDFIRELIEAEKLKPVIEKVYPLDQIAEAQRHVAKGHTKGKVVVEIQN